MEFNTIKNHPDFLEILAAMGREANKHERNMKIGGGFIAAGASLMTIGVIIVKVEEHRLKSG